MVGCASWRPREDVGDAPYGRGYFLTGVFLDNGLFDLNVDVTEVVLPSVSHGAIQDIDINIDKRLGRVVYGNTW